MENAKQSWDLVRIKADLICYGVKHNEITRDIYHNQNVFKNYKTGNVGIHIILENGSSVLVTVEHEFDSLSPYSIIKEKDHLYLVKDQEKQSEISVIPMPKWYLKNTTNDTPMASIFLHEGKNFLHQTYKGCDFFKSGGQCKFCGTGSDWKMGAPEEIGETVNLAFTENKKYQVCLGGGTRVPLKKNVEYFLSCLKAIKKNNSSVPVWIEMIPPSLDEIQQLIDAGATSFGFNIEIWDDALRKQICPMKSTTSKQHYLDAMKYVLNKLGPNKVGSGLIVGLQPKESLIEGIQEVSSIGSKACIIPFKPWDKSEYKHRPLCKPEELIQISKIAAEATIDNNIDPNENQGCLNCESCTIDKDCYNILLNARNERQK